MTRPAVLTVALAGLLLAGCAGPSRTDADYRLKVANTAKAMGSVVATAQLTVRVATAGRAPNPYVQVSLDDALSDANGIQTSFDAVQSPSPAGDQLRQATDDQLAAAISAITDLLSAVRRNQVPSLTQAAQPLDTVATRLRQLEQAG